MKICGPNTMQMNFGLGDLLGDIFGFLGNLGNGFHIGTNPGGNIGMGLLPNSNAMNQGGFSGRIRNPAFENVRNAPAGGRFGNQEFGNNEFRNQQFRNQEYGN